jgi:hypothetical protein
MTGSWVAGNRRRRAQIKFLQRPFKMFGTACDTARVRRVLAVFSSADECLDIFAGRWSTSLYLATGKCCQFSRQKFGQLRAAMTELVSVIGNAQLQLGVLNDGIGSSRVYLAHIIYGIPHESNGLIKVTVGELLQFVLRDRLQFGI